jgi:hypothetical protein
VYEKRTGFSLKLPKMREQCTECEHRFSREPGFFQGAMYVSYGLAMAEVIATFVLCQFFFDRVFDVRMFGIIVGVVVLLSLFNYRLSRVIWMYLFTPKQKTVEG